MNLSGAAAGFNQFDAQQQQKQAQAVELARVLQAMSIQAQQAQAAGQDRALGLAGARNAGNAFAGMPPPPVSPMPQPPLPGASSPGGTPVGGPPPQPAAPPAGPMAGSLPQPPPGAIAGAPAGAPPPGWQPMPKPPPVQPGPPGGPMGAELPPPPAATQNDAGVVMPKNMSSPNAVAQQLKKDGKSGEEIMATLTAMSPFWTAAQKQELDQAKMLLQVQTEARKFAEDRLKDLRDQKRLDQGDKRLDQADRRMDQQAEQAAQRDDRAERRFQAILAKGNDPNGKLDASDIQFMAGQYLSGDTSVMQNLGRGVQGSKNIVALRGEIRKQAEAKGMTPAQVASAMAEFQGEKAGQRTLGTRTANIEMAATEADSLADLALNASNKLGRTGIKSLNTAIQSVEKGTASPELRRFVAANTSFINAYARAINPQGVGTVADKEHAREMLDVAFSKGDYAAVIDQLKSEIAAAKASPGTVKGEMRERFTGGTKPKGGGPTPGTIENGYRFKGGDPANQASWEKV